MKIPEALPPEYHTLTSEQADLLSSQVKALGMLALSPASHAAGLFWPAANGYQVQQGKTAPQEVLVWPSPYEVNAACIYVGNPKVPADTPYFMITTEQADSYSVRGVALNAYNYHPSFYISTQLENAHNGKAPIITAIRKFDEIAKAARENNQGQADAAEFQVRGLASTAMESMILGMNSYAQGVADSRREAPFRHNLVNPTFRMANAVFGHMLQLAGNGLKYDPPIQAFHSSVTPIEVTARGVVIPGEASILSLHQPSLRDPTIVLTEIPIPTDIGPVYATQHRMQPTTTAVTVHELSAADCNVQGIPKILPIFDKISSQQPLEISTDLGIGIAHRILAQLLQSYGLSSPV